MGKLNDDCLILAKIKDGYIYFWYDKDCSDCSIGKFETDDSESEVIVEFEKMIDESNHPKIEIPINLFTGWISG